MTRRRNPEAIYIARRMAVRNTLTGAGMDEQLAERWCDAWEAEAGRRGLKRLSPDYWADGAFWIAAERAARRSPG